MKRTRTKNGDAIPRATLWQIKNHPDGFFLFFNDASCVTITTGCNSRLSASYTGEEPGRYYNIVIHDEDVKHVTDRRVRTIKEVNALLAFIAEEGGARSWYQNEKVRGRVPSRVGDPIVPAAVATPKTFGYDPERGLKEEDFPSAGETRINTGLKGVFVLASKDGQGFYNLQWMDEDGKTIGERSVDIQTLDRGVRGFLEANSVTNDIFDMAGLPGGAQ